MMIGTIFFNPLNKNRVFFLFKQRIKLWRWESFFTVTKGRRRADVRRIRKFIRYYTKEKNTTKVEEWSMKEAHCFHKFIVIEILSYLTVVNIIPMELSNLRKICCKFSKIYSNLTSSVGNKLKLLAIWH